MSDLSRFVANKLSGEWSASNVSGVLTDVIIEYLVTGEKWESLDPLVRSRLLLAPLFMRKRDLAELRPALAKLAAAGAADKDEWVRAMAQSVDGYDGRLHNDRLLSGSKLVGKTVAGLQPVLDAADSRLFRPLEEVYMNKELLQKLRGSSAAQGGAQQPAAAPVAAAPKAHHHFRLRPASEAPSQRHPAGSAAAAGRPAVQAAPAAGAAPQAVLARGAAQPARPVGASGLGSRGPGAVSGAAPSATGRLRQTGGGADIDSMFLPRKPSLQRPAGLGGRGRGAAAPPVRRAATLDVEAAKNLAQQMQAERAKAEQAAREAAEAEARAKAEAKAAERAVREAEKEVEAKRRAAEKAAAKEAARAEKEAAKAAARAAKDDGKEEREKAKAARAEAAAAKAAAKAAKPQQRKRPGSEGGEPPAKRSATGGSEGEQRATALPTPEAAAEALGEAALAAAADAAGMQLGGRGRRPDVEAMQAYLAAAYGGGGQPGSSSAGDVEEEHI